MTPRTTTNTGIPVASDDESLTAGTQGPILLHDHYLIEKLAQFNRERVPERIVHAKGGGAFGELVITGDVSRYTKAKLFAPGAKTESLVRFSTVAGEQGSPDTWRDPRGFAIKFYTEDGNYDLVGNNTPVFFIKDPIKFPDFIRSQKRLPGSGLRDHNMQWDFWTLRPETAHQVTWLMGDRGIPKSWRHMDGFGSHTYQWVNADGERFWVKYHFKTDQGIEFLTQAEADTLAGSDPDYHRQDLYEAIENGEFPSWTLKVQIMPVDEAEEYRFNPFDLTKVWSQQDYSLIEVGTWTLNRNPQNFFSEIELASFEPSNVVPGVGFSPDKMLLGRVFAYADSHRDELRSAAGQFGETCRGQYLLQGGRDGIQLLRPRRSGIRAQFIWWTARRSGCRGRRRALVLRRRGGACRLHRARRGQRLGAGGHDGARRARRCRTRTPRRQHRRTRARRCQRAGAVASVRVLAKRRRGSGQEGRIGRPSRTLRLKSC